MSAPAGGYAMEQVQELYGQELAGLHHRNVLLRLELHAAQTRLEELEGQQPAAGPRDGAAPPV